MEAFGTAFGCGARRYAAAGHHLPARQLRETLLYGLRHSDVHGHCLCGWHPGPSGLARAGLTENLLLTLAVVDDIGAVLVIAIFYTSGIDVVFIVAALLLFVVMLWLNKSRHVDALWLYLALGIVLWALIMASGVHATIAGVLTAVAMPYRDGGEKRPAVRAERWLHLPVYWVILPLFVLSNTAIVLKGPMLAELFRPHALGIMAGLLIGKPLGIFVMSWLVITLGLAEMPPEMNTRHLLAAGCLGGIGFTMSIFIAALSFDSPMMVDSAKIAILLSSAAAAVIGMVLLARGGKSADRA